MFLGKARLPRTVRNNIQHKIVPPDVLSRTRRSVGQPLCSRHFPFIAQNMLLYNRRKSIEIRGSTLTSEAVGRAYVSTWKSTNFLATCRYSVRTVQLCCCSSFSPLA
jgi:hypothetical protein